MYKFLYCYYQKFRNITLQGNKLYNNEIKI